MKITGDTVKSDLSTVGDTNLMRRFQGGDEACFRELVVRYGQLIFDYVFRLSRGSEQAERIVRDVFVRAWQRGDSFRPSMKFKVWLLTLCRNHCREVLPDGRFSLRLFFAGLVKPGSILLDKLPAPGYLPSAYAACFDESSLAVKREVDMLSLTEREIFVLARYLNRPYDEIEQITGVPAAEVRRILSAVKLSLTERVRGILQ